MTSSRFRAVLVDADGVIQTVDPGWVQRLKRFCPERRDESARTRAERGPERRGTPADRERRDESARTRAERGPERRGTPGHGDEAETFIRELFDAEKGPLSGHGEWADAIAGVLRRRGIPEVYTADVILPWAIIEQWPDCLEVVREVAASTPCYLATNQTRFRADIMRTFGYQDVFEQLLFSYELGAHKPDPEYFAAALARVGCRPEEAFFVDDKLANVEVARSSGITAAHHDPGTGAAGLRALFADAGLLPER